MASYTVLNEFGKSVEIDEQTDLILKSLRRMGKTSAEGERLAQDQINKLPSIDEKRRFDKYLGEIDRVVQSFENEQFLNGKPINWTEKEKKDAWGIAEHLKEKCLKKWGKIAADIADPQTAHEGYEALISKCNDFFLEIQEIDNNKDFKDKTKISERIDALKRFDKGLDKIEEKVVKKDIKEGTDERDRLSSALKVFSQEGDKAVRNMKDLFDLENNPMGIVDMAKNIGESLFKIALFIRKKKSEILANNALSDIGETLPEFGKYIKDKDGKYEFLKDDKGQYLDKDGNVTDDEKEFVKINPFIKEIRIPTKEDIDNLPSTPGKVNIGTDYIIMDENENKYKIMPANYQPGDTLSDYKDGQTIPVRCVFEIDPQKADELNIPIGDKFTVGGERLRRITDTLAISTSAVSTLTLNQDKEESLTNAFIKNVRIPEKKDIDSLPPEVKSTNYEYIVTEEVQNKKEYKIMKNDGTLDDYKDGTPPIRCVLDVDADMADKLNIKQGDEFTWGDVSYIRISDTHAISTDPVNAITLDPQKETTYTNKKGNSITEKIPLNKQEKQLLKKYENELRNEYVKHPVPLEIQEKNFLESLENELEKKHENIEINNKAKEIEKVLKKNKNNYRNER